ncbi:MAG: S41 family peptidase [Gemmatimonadaceae bacterium]
MRPPRLPKYAVLATLAVPALVGGFLAQERPAADGPGLFGQVMTLVSERFVDSLGAGAVYERAARGLVERLDDPYSELFSPEQLERFTTESFGRYAGVGMLIEDQQGQITVVRVYPNTPAEAAGIQTADRIVAVEGLSTRGWSTQRVSSHLKGSPSSAVRVTVARDGVARPIEHRLKRATIHVPAVPYAIMLDGDVGYIPLLTFSETAAAEIRTALDRLARERARGIVLDLRGNGGGILEEALAVSNLFLEKKQVILTRRERRSAPETYVADGRQRAPDVPIVLLVDGYSASASEIVAGALQDHDRALVVGTTSYGKGLVQGLFPLEGGYALKLTTGRWFTPSGRSIHKDRPRDTSARERNEELPDSLESEAVKQTRPQFRSDAGRIVYGGGGITPDVIVPADTISTAEQRLARSVAPHTGVVRAQLFEMARQLRGTVDRAFAVLPEWREEFYQRLARSGVTIDRGEFDRGAPLVDRWISTQVARLAFGDSAAMRRSVAEDSQLLRATELLRSGDSLRNLLAGRPAGAPGS